MNIYREYPRSKKNDFSISLYYKNRKVAFMKYVNNVYYCLKYFQKKGVIFDTLIIWDRRTGAFIARYTFYV